MREVRHTVIRVITDHLRADERRAAALQDWRGLELDFTSAAFDGGESTTPSSPTARSASTAPGSPAAWSTSTAPGSPAAWSASDSPSSLPGGSASTAPSSPAARSASSAPGSPAARSASTSPSSPAAWSASDSPSSPAVRSTSAAPSSPAARLTSGQPTGQYPLCCQTGIIRQTQSCCPRTIPIGPPVVNGDYGKPAASWPLAVASIHVSADRGESRRGGVRRRLRTRRLRCGGLPGSRRCAVRPGPWRPRHRLAALGPPAGSAWSS
jgi:hypothetical protein